MGFLSSCCSQTKKETSPTRQVEKERPLIPRPGNNDDRKKLEDHYRTVGLETLKQPGTQCSFKIITDTDALQKLLVSSTLPVASTSKATQTFITSYDLQNNAAGDIFGFYKALSQDDRKIIQITALLGRVSVSHVKKPGPSFSLKTIDLEHQTVTIQSTVQEHSTDVCIPISKLGTFLMHKKDAQERWANCKNKAQLTMGVHLQGQLKDHPHYGEIILSPSKTLEKVVKISRFDSKIKLYVKAYDPISKTYLIIAPLKSGRLVSTDFSIKEISNRLYKNSEAKEPTESPRYKSFLV